MMKVTVLFFGATADEAGTVNTEFDLPADSSSEEAFDTIISTFPGLTANRDRGDLLYALNREYVSGGEEIKEGDELAVFTAVSGG
ncbi:MAG TPA: MoaD/ThiS family protein [Aridibacter sp.]|nr:MoaD/ThiS family protein [Aridibacter sp.]